MIVKDLLPSIKEYGNIHLYFPHQEEPTQNIAMHFIKGQDKHLEIITTVDTFDRPFWDGKTEDHEAEPRIRVPITKTPKEHLRNDVALLITASFRKDILYIVEKGDNDNYDLLTEDFIKFLNPMFETNLDLMKEVVKSKNRLASLLNYLENNAYLPIKEEEILPLDEAMDRCIQKGEYFFKRMVDLERIWNKLNHVTSVQEYQQIKEKFDSYTLPEKGFTYQKKK